MSLAPSPSESSSCIGVAFSKYRFRAHMLWIRATLLVRGVALIRGRRLLVFLLSYAALIRGRHFIGGSAFSSEYDIHYWPNHSMTTYQAQSISWNQHSRMKVKVHLSGLKWAVLSGTFCLLSVVGTEEAVELLTVFVSTSHETTELSELVGHEWEEETVLLNNVSLVLDVTDCKRSQVNSWL